MSWQKQNLIPPLPPEAQQIVDSLNTVVGTVSPVISAAVTILDAAKTFMVLMADLYAALMTALITEVENFVNDTFGSGAYELIIHPVDIYPGIKRDKYGFSKITPGDAINLAIKSFDDQGDPNRPQFSDGANVAAFGIMVSAPDIGVFIFLMEAIVALWKVNEFEEILNRAKKKKGKYKKKTLDYYSSKPDWGSLRFNQIEYLGDLQKEMLNLLAIAKGYATVPDNVLVDLIDALARKLELLNDTIAAIMLIINTIANIGQLADMWVLDIPLGPGGNKRIQQALVDAQLSGMKINKYSMLMLYVGGGPSAAGVELIRSLLL